jgi:hypothetical protein
MAAKTKTVAPAEQFAELLPKITTRELYGVAVAILLEGAERAENYADAAWADEAPREIAEEGLSFVGTFGKLWSWLGADPVSAGRGQCCTTPRRN